MAAGKGHSSGRIRACLRKRGIARTIPERINQINGRLRGGERLCRLDPVSYQRRSVVERRFGRLRQNRALATRCDKRAVHY